MCTWHGVRVRVRVRVRGGAHLVHDVDEVLDVLCTLREGECDVVDAAVHLVGGRARARGVGVGAGQVRISPDEIVVEIESEHGLG